MYCIYSDRDVSNKNGTYDHIFPLALGGKNQFCIWSDKQCNSQIGTQVDGAMAADPLIELALRNSGVTGQRNRIRTPRWRRSQLDGTPVQVTLGAERITVWDAKLNRDLTQEEIGGRSITTTLHIGLYTCLRFVAKAALAGGYFLYGDKFTTALDCDQLRSLVFLGSDHDEIKRTFENCEIRFCDRFHPDSNPTSEARIYQTITKSLQRSMFITIPHPSSISFHVGVVGVYIGSMSIPAATDQLPFDEEHDLGHCIVLGPGDMQRLSCRALLGEFLSFMEANAKE